MAASDWMELKERQWKLAELVMGHGMEEGDLGNPSRSKRRY